jgi:hypothetical protein
MRTHTRLMLPALLAAFVAIPAAAQDVSGGGAADTPAATAADSARPARPPASGPRSRSASRTSAPSTAAASTCSRRPRTTACPTRASSSCWAPRSLQQFQTVDHSNTAAANVVNGVNQNQLADIGPGFNNAVANLYITAQLARGISVHMTSYLSSRHHSETWVKDGYLQIDESPLDVPVLNSIMRYTTIKFGEMELNYGDSHFRRTDNGNSIYNPFVGNLIMDAFTTEAGAEVYVQHNGFLAMGGSPPGSCTRR